MTGNGRILVVDDGLETLLQVGAVLEAAGYQALGTSDPEEAKLLVEREDLSVVVLSADLAHISGYELLAGLRAIPAGAFLPVLLLSLQSGAMERIEGLGLGIVDFLLQPYAPAELVLRLACLVQRRNHLRGGFCGGLETYPLADLAQSIALGRRSGALEIANRAVGGRLHFHNGELVSACAGDRRGQAAVEALLELQSGEFSFRPGKDTEVPATEPGLGLQRMLLDAAWLTDELRRRQRFLPKSDQMIVPTGRPLSTEAAEAQSLPLRGILTEVERAGAITLGELAGQGLASQRRLHLAVAWLIEHDVLAGAATALDTASRQDPRIFETG